MLELYKKVEQFVVQSFEKKVDIEHSKRTVYWVKQLKPDADEALLIAGIGHDIDRAFRKPQALGMPKLQASGFTDKEFLRRHQDNSARIVAEFLEKQKASQEMIDRVKMLVSKHEEGGNDAQDVLKDADSVSHFENCVELFLTEAVEEVGKDKVRQKFDWMYNRITSEKAKQITKPWYEKAIKDLETSHFLETREK